MTSPVAGFSTGMPPSPLLDAVAVDRCSTVAMCGPLLSRFRVWERRLSDAGCPASRVARGVSPNARRGPHAGRRGGADHPRRAARILHACARAAARARARAARAGPRRRRPVAPPELTAGEARAAIGARELSPVELLDAVLDRIRARNDELHAYLLVDEERARAAARAAEAAAADADPRLLLGIPICVKDVIDVAGLPTTAGAAGWRREPADDAPAVARLRAAGAVIVGKGNTNEFAYGIDGRNPHWGDVVNPLDPARLPGGSSAGPAVAVAPGVGLPGVGTGPTGWVRVPAALCGLTALRPTLGAVPVQGVVPLAWSYDVVGPIVRSVPDAALLWSVLSGDPVAGDARLPRVGVLDQLFDGAVPAVAAGVRAVAEGL